MQGVKEKALELLRSGKVDRVLGWKEGEFFYDLTPAVFESEAAAEKDFCYSLFWRVVLQSQYSGGRGRKTPPASG